MYYYYLANLTNMFLFYFPFVNVETRMGNVDIKLMIKFRNVMVISTGK